MPLAVYIYLISLVNNPIGLVRLFSSLLTPYIYYDNWSIVAA